MTTKADRSRIAMATRYQRLLSAGLCVDCGVEDVSGTAYVTCRACRIERSKRRARRARRLKVRCRKCGRRRSPHAKSGRCLRCHLVEMNKTSARDARGRNTKIISPPREIVVAIVD